MIIAVGEVLSNWVRLQGLELPKMWDARGRLATFGVDKKLKIVIQAHLTITVNPAH